MKNKNFWIGLSLFHLFTVAVLGMILRSKMLFSLPFLDYNHLLHTHGHFAFGGWVTLALMVLITNAFLTEQQKNKSVYQYIFTGIVISVWGLLLTLPSASYTSLSSYISTGFICITYIFSWIFIKDIFSARVSNTTLLLSLSALVCLVLSSIASFGLAYLFAIKSLNAILYRDALFSYLHLQYNGFFTLAVFALLFHKLETRITDETKKQIHRFSLFLVFSIIPSMFLSYHWHNPNVLFEIVAIIGSILLLITLWSFIVVIKSLRNQYKLLAPMIKFLGVISIGAFMLKLFLQSFTIIDFLGNLVFGTRPIIMGFLHLVFLCFVSLFLLAYITKSGLLNLEKIITRIALIVFALAVVVNEMLLWTQGIGDVFIQSSSIFPWLLWGAALWLLAGAFLILISYFVSNSTNKKALSAN